ncbi:MAG: hypothetical protein AAGF74_12820 [Pseudomonadota bacterium]
MTGPSEGGIVLILGSGPAAPDCETWAKHPFDEIVAINNAWAVRPDWSYLIHPEDFPASRLPPMCDITQTVVTAEDYVPLQNAFGGFVYAGGTMAFTAGYWALAALKPKVLAWFACDMVYPRTGPTHFYGEGTADPLREDVTLRSLEAKSARLAVLAAEAGCHCVNLSDAPSRLTFPRARQEALVELAETAPRSFDPVRRTAALERERRLDYHVPSGRYWLEADRFDVGEIDALDRLWLAAEAAELPASSAA